MLTGIAMKLLILFGELVHSLARKMGKIRLKHLRCIDISSKNIKTSKMPLLLTGYYRNMLE